MSTKDILQRYLTARADVDENAGVLAACIKIIISQLMQ